MPLNALRFGAKCSAFWFKTQDKMVQNAGSVLKNRQNNRRERLEIVVIYLLFNSIFR
jgi:hypothetical protein